MSATQGTLGGSFDITPIVGVGFRSVSAVHPNPINCLATTRNAKWLFTGSDDGFIRKYDIYGAVHGSTLLTGLQKHGLVDSIQKARRLLLMARLLYSPQKPPAFAGLNVPGIGSADAQQSAALVSTIDASLPQEPAKVSPVYSLDVHSEGVWCLSGTESGSINLWSVRHEEGKLQHVIRGHRSTVSCLSIGLDERSCMSGSWDKTVKLWSLDTGAVINEYKHHISQITSISLNRRSNLYLTTSYDGTGAVIDPRTPAGLVAKLEPNGSRIFIGRRNASVDEFEFNGTCVFTRNLKMPPGSGNVTAVEALPNNRHLLVGSFDNIRCWDLDHKSLDNPTTPMKKDDSDLDLDGAIQDDLFPGLKETQPMFEKDYFKSQDRDGDLKARQSDIDALDQELPAPSVPFTIIPGHHGALISGLASRGNILISTSGNKGYEGHSNNLCLIYSVKKLEELARPDSAMTQ
ncbi:Transcription factor spt8 [Kappamyces sp. JEL0829]|nr:Transcription factor spt8 [Kappamyces sp. JEL0829]